jgi:hypothetical protein
VSDGVEAARSIRLTEECYACRSQLEEPWQWYRPKKAVVLEDVR